MNIKKSLWFLVFAAMSACVQRVDFNAPAAQLLTVVEGVISDSPGPYTIKVSKGLSLDESSLVGTPVRDMKIKLYDDLGNTEDFTEDSPGIYKTKGIIHGKIGHTYRVVLETREGEIFESEPERINPVGEVVNIRYEFEARTIVKKFGEVNADVFNVYVDANGGSGNENYVRWRLTGTFKVVTYPELNETFTPPYTPYKDPWPCSGYILLPEAGTGGKLEKIGDCTCCICWINQYESIPQLSDAQLVSENQFKNVKVGEVAINNLTFFEKYLAEVEQMSLSRKSFEFFKLVRSQKEGASSLFQPPAGVLKGNIKSANSNEPVVGFFWATSIKKKSIFIYSSDVPYLIPPRNTDTRPCTSYTNSTTIKPALWE
ncbi:MAG: DUF4249 family protein [Cyclobacteriaceae bacterium]